MRARNCVIWVLAVFIISPVARGDLSWSEPTRTISYSHVVDDYLLSSDSQSGIGLEDFAGSLYYQHAGTMSVSHTSNYANGVFISQGSAAASSYTVNTTDHNQADNTLTIPFTITGSTPYRLSGTVDARAQTYYGAATPTSQVRLTSGGQVLFEYSADGTWIPDYDDFGYYGSRYDASAVLDREGTLEPGDYTFTITTSSEASSSYEYSAWAVTSHDVRLELVPEPASLSMLLMGGLALIRRRRR